MSKRERHPGSPEDAYRMWDKLTSAEILAPALLSALGYIFTRAAARIDSFTKELQRLREEVGAQKMINKALWRNIDDLKILLKEQSINSRK